MLPYNLIANDYFIASVAAHNAQGDSLFSLDSLPQKVYNRPDQPYNLKNEVILTSEKEICLSWDRPVSDGGLPINFYTVQLYSDVQLSVLTLSEKTGTEQQKICVTGVVAR
jgi:hypothetical protein